MSSSPDLSLRVRTMQIIAGALAAGSTIVLGIAVFLVQSRQGEGVNANPDQLPVVSLVAVVMLLIQIPMAVSLPAMITSKALANLADHAPDTHVAAPGQVGYGLPVGDREYLLGVRQTTMIISMALVEGASFVGSIAYIVEGRLFVLTVSLVGILLILASFPTRDRVQMWLDAHLRGLSDLRAKKARIASEGS
jgi:hypothetical protein